MERIVVGADGSEASKDALRWAVDEARLRGAELVALHAWEPLLGAPDVGPASRIDLVELVTDAYEEALQLVTGIVEEVVGDDEAVEVSAVAVEGAAASALIDAARDASLLVVGSRGHGGFEGLLLGSVSQQVAGHSPCPVVIHRRPDAG
jgi:nucleotide-binding universal stress UspA family protein